ncbi:hypothetical protein HYV83_03655 [Candidatus Woesearchaeota archaeon]|nr:hypothetical protein [Candidatus Woesearchaeota archaeon]
MIVRFSASNIVAMILFIPILIALAIVFAFLVPLLALIIAIAGILFTTLYVFAKIGLVKPKSSGARLGPVDTSRLGKGKVGKAKNVRDYRIR